MWCDVKKTQNKRCGHWPGVSCSSWAQFPVWKWSSRRCGLKALLLSTPITYTRTYLTRNGESWKRVIGPLQLFQNTHNIHKMNFKHLTAGYYFSFVTKYVCCGPQCPIFTLLFPSFPFLIILCARSSYSIFASKHDLIILKQHSF